MDAVAAAAAAGVAPHLLAAASAAPNGGGGASSGLIWALAAAPGAGQTNPAQKMSAFMPWNVGKDGKATIAIPAQE